MFFFSSRRRHTRLQGDWSSDVCSSDLAILLEDVKDDKGPTSVADRLTAELQQPFTVEGREVVITVSIGIAMSTARRMTPEDILRDADLAMYHAKGKGKARYEIFDK